MACGLPLRSMSRKWKLTRDYKFWKRLSARWKQAEKQGGKIRIGGVWEKWGVRGAWEAWDRVRRGAPGSVFRVGEGERLCEICVCGGGFLGGGSCRRGDLGERHDREGEMSHAGKGICGKGMTGKARRVMPERDFLGKGMIGKARWVMPERDFWGKGMTGKARRVMPEGGFWGSRHDREGEEGHAGKGICGSRHDRRTVSTCLKRKSKFMACAERPSRPRQRTQTHAKKEKASLRRVRSAHLARAREPKHTSKRKSKSATCAERPSRPHQRTKVHVKKEKASL